ncbi:hypothetical protein ZWY2020_039571 [Hordeum vulgare]|nr:hypothetical protein ZWY2020_039571 [Hordeum vulgare]
MRRGDGDDKFIHGQPDDLVSTNNGSSWSSTLGYSPRSGRSSCVTNGAAWASASLSFSALVSSTEPSSGVELLRFPLANPLGEAVVEGRMKSTLYTCFCLPPMPPKLGLCY